MLIIPAMHISQGRCARTAVGEPGTEGSYPMTPVEVARMWRGENAKALHVVAHDFSTSTSIARIDVLRDVVHAVDIAVQLGGVFSSVDDVRLALDEVGVYRVVIDPAEFEFDGELDALVEKYGPRRIVVDLRVKHGQVIFREDGSQRSAEALGFAQRLVNAGVHRVLVTEIREEENIGGPPADFLLCLAETTNLSITLNGSVRHFRDLKLLQNLHPKKIDSVVLDEVLYTNRFPCQRIWRLAEQKLLAQHKPL